MPLPAQSMEEPEIEVEDDPGGMIGRVLADRFRITGLLGVGGIGRVYRAQHLGLGRDVALKILLEHYANVPELQQRFEREAMALSALRHPNIVTITDFVADPRVTFLVMELVDGDDLDTVLEAGLPTEAALSVMEQILSCLAYAHARGVIHRDLKPQNVLVSELPGGRLHAVVLDFGLAKFTEMGGKHDNLTKTGLIVGTPAYMAPEQAGGGRADKRSDVYSAGVLLFEMLTGRLPFDGEQSDVLRQHLLRPPPTLAEACPGAEVAPELEALIAKTLKKDTGDRYPDASALLRAFLALPPSPFRKPTSGPTPARTNRGISTAETHHAALAAPSVARRAEARPLGRTLLAGLGGAILAALLVSALFLAAWPSSESAVPRAGDAPVDTDLEPELGAADELEADLTFDEDELVEPDDVAEPPEEAADPSLDEEADAPIEDEEGPVAADPPPPRERPPAVNPWQGRTPATLAQVRRRVSRGHPITKRHIRQVARYRRSHPGDVRSTLVLAHAYAARGWLTHSLAQYRRAYLRQPSSRGDARMKRDLIRFVATATLHDAATEALAEIYGEEAREALRRAAARESDPAARARLEDALARITGR